MEWTIAYALKKVLTSKTALLLELTILEAYCVVEMKIAENLNFVDHEFEMY